MSAPNLFDNYSLTNSQNKNYNYSQFYSSDENKNNENIEETTVTENNTTENDVQNNNNKNKNFIEKTDVNNNSLIFFPTNFFTNLEHLDVLEQVKMVDNYYMETLFGQYYNKENKETTISESRNFIPKEKFINNNMIYYYETAKLYYYIKINNIFFCTYVDQKSRIYKRFYYLPQKGKSKKRKKAKKK